MYFIDLCDPSPNPQGVQSTRNFNILPFCGYWRLQVRLESRLEIEHSRNICKANRENILSTPEHKKKSKSLTPVTQCEVRIPVKTNRDFMTCRQKKQSC